ncbi:MAG: hypothetical protein B6D61_13590 [Bacteroidetes bacterium 4484_249]|nr:MAG: hypothetical protein B6D61_13590 [Bacteroidetes bacterium 4484_249]
MIKEREQQINNIFGVLDVFLSVLSFFIAYLLRSIFFDTNVEATDEYLAIGILIIPTWFILLKSVHLTEMHRTKRYSMILVSYLKVIVVGLGVIFLFVFLFKMVNVSRFVIVLFGVISLMSMFTVRITVYRIMKHFRVKGFNSRNVVIIADDSSEEFIEKILTNKEWGYILKYVITNSSKLYKKYRGIVSVHPERINLRNLIDVDVIDEVIYCKNEINQKRLKSLLHDCEEVGVVFRMQSLFSRTTTKAHLNHFDETPFLTFDNTPSDQFALKVKNTLSVTAAFFILLIWSPVLLAIAVVIKATSKGPIFFKQKRVGLRGRTFLMYKFRTMVQNAEALQADLMDANEADGPVFKIKNDPRITKIGKFLRKSGLDELPQFINVLIGDMSLVGPRPPIPSEVEQYERWQLRRLSIKPGITCTWQIKPNRNSISFDDWMKMDLHYIDNWSNKIDLVLFFKTISTMLKGSGS